MSSRIEEFTVRRGWRKEGDERVELEATEETYVLRPPHHNFS